ncbi:9738_t:CDS:1 [Cetraspora pellucida]|uniref:9738_t:CDS:1 n=1 Tax=Cetraspora pellucida TaxID=1433469 RepID=A0A9N9FUS1_9GLOM|nr:9738_t:CDS:1 [Cetraspora pellucida]
MNLERLLSLNNTVLNVDIKNNHDTTFDSFNINNNFNSNDNKALDSDFNDILGRSLSDILDKDFNDNYILHEITSVSNNSATLTVGQTFAKWHDVEQYVNAYAIKQGFATRLNCTEKNLGFLTRAKIVCHHAGTPSDKSTRLQTTRSIAIGCPWKIVVR